MKYLSLLILMALSNLTWATENVGFFVCSFDRIDKNWEFFAYSFPDQAESLPANRNNLLQTGGTQYENMVSGYCVTTIGTDSDEVHVRGVVTKGERKTDFSDYCDPYDGNAQILSEDYKTLNRGENFELVEPNLENGTPETLIHVHYAQAGELSGSIEQNAEKYCTGLSPSSIP
jgi:hypothetical protein